jgi:hypothetical protein
MSNPIAKRRLCNACDEGRHWDCSGSVSCNCDCDMEAIDYGHDPDLDESGICRICGVYEPE